MTNSERRKLIKALTPGELAVLALNYKINTHCFEASLLLNETMPWVVLDAQDHPRLWYAFFATEEDAIRMFLSCHGDIVI